MNRFACLPLFAALAGLGLSGASRADTPSGDEAGLSVSLGAELGNRSMTGNVSDKPKWSATVGLNFRNGRFFAGTERGVGYNVVQLGGFQAFVSVGVDPGRKEGNAKDSPRLVGMGKVDASGLLMTGVAYQALKGLVSVNAVHMASTTRSHGSQTLLNAALNVPLAGDTLTGFVSLGATHADRRSAQTFYGVTAAQAARSGNPVYAAKAGWISCDYSLGVNAELDRHWSVSASVGRHEWLDAAEHSPLFTARKGHVGSANLSYRF